jgi:hypothetical protein
LKSRLIGEHVRIHQLDFEIFENDQIIRILPHDEQIGNAIKTLPITDVDLKEEGNKTKVTITSRMRKIDSGGPFLIVIFCSFMLIASLILLYVDPKETTIPYVLLGIALSILTLFTIRMQTGYFDYVRKIRDYVKSKGEHTLANVNAPLVQA